MPTFTTSRSGDSVTIRKDGAHLGYLTLEDGFPYWSPGIPRTRDGALKIPKDTTREALVALGWQPALGYQPGCSGCATHGNWCRTHGHMRSVQES